jgi:hypothetical protein
MLVTSQKRRPFTAISVKVTGKNQDSAEYRDAPNRPVRWSIVVKKKSTVGSSFLGTFPSDRIPKATNDVNVLFFIPSNNSYKLCQRIPGTFLKILRM